MHDLLGIQESIQNNVIHFAKEALVFCCFKEWIATKSQASVNHSNMISLKSSRFSRGSI
jgi:hypothetical protein